VRADRPRSDAFVFFGATGDLAYKKIFPALQNLTRRGRLDMPVVGVAKSGWNRDQLVERAKASVTEYGGLDPEVFPERLWLGRLDPPLGIAFGHHVVEVGTGLARDADRVQHHREDQ